MHGRLVWAGLGALAVLSSQSLALAQCTKDTDCKGERVCESGQCAWPVAPTPVAPTPVAPTPVAPVVAEPPPKRRAAPPAAVAPLAVEAPALRRSRPAMITGIALVSVAPLALLGALAARSAQVSCDDALERDYPDRVVPTSQRYRVARCDGYTTPLYVLGIGGGLLTAVGIPLIIYGAPKISPERASLQVSPWASAASGGLNLRLQL